MDVDGNEPGTQTIITQGPSGNSQIIHVRQDSASELEALFNTVMNPSLKNKSQSLPMKSRKLPKSFFVQPDRPRQTPHFHHSHSQSMGVLGVSTQPIINHSRSSSSDSSASHASPATAAAASNSNNNNGASVASPGLPPGSPLSANLNQKVAYSYSPAQRRVAHSQFVNARNHNNLQVPQVSHIRSKSSPASLELLDITPLQVKPSDIPPDMPLPPGWSAAKTSDGQQYFMNHNNRSTTWEDPRIPIIKQQRQVVLQNQSLIQQNQSTNAAHTTNAHSSNLQNDISVDSFPPGWEQSVTSQGDIYFINHQTQSTSWDDPRIQNPQQNNGTQSNNSQLQQQLMKVNQMDMAGAGSVNRGNFGQQSMIKHLIQDKEITMRRHILKQQLSSGGVDPFLGSGNPNFHQRDPSLDSGLGMGSNYSLPRGSDDYLANVEEMDTGDGARRLHGQSGHIVATSNHQPQHGNHGNASRFPDFLDTLPASSVDFSTGNNPVAQQQSIAQACPNSGAPPSLDSNDLDFDVESVLNNVKTESVDSPMVWI